MLAWLSVCIFDWNFTKNATCKGVIHFAGRQGKQESVDYCTYWETEYYELSLPSSLATAVPLNGKVRSQKRKEESEDEVWSAIN